MQTQLDPKENIYTVSRLNSEVRYLLEDTFSTVWVEGEISNFSAPHSGHWYFGLKDANAQVRCAMFRGNQRKLSFVPKDGVHVLIKARVSLYENRGDFQLIAEDMEERGEGKLRRAFELLKKKLESQGLFNPDHKKSLPSYPKKIGIITSPTGAAIRDILTVLKRRFSCVPIIIYPTLVQGNSASANIVSAIQLAEKRNECDVLIVTRGGGSLEDLWPFNEEIVAHAIYQCPIPIVSGVGHEVDFTIADFVADVRAPTPSAAAEILTPDCNELLQLLTRHDQILLNRIKAISNRYQQQVSWMAKHLSQQHPKKRLQEKMQRLDFFEMNLTQLQTRLQHLLQTKIKNFETALHRQSPTNKITQLQNLLQIQQQKINNLAQINFNQKKNQLGHIATKLDALSPLATLQRGFAIASKDNKIIYDANQVNLGDEIQVRLNKSHLVCDVTKIS